MELRHHQRFPVHFHTVLSGPQLSESVGTIVNLSEGGCHIESDSEVYTGIQLALGLHLPGEDSPISIEKAVVCWNRGRAIGVGFVIVAPLQQERLSHLITRLKKEQKT